MVETSTSPGGTRSSATGQGTRVEFLECALRAHRRDSHAPYARDAALQDFCRLYHAMARRPSEESEFQTEQRCHAFSPDEGGAEWFWTSIREVPVIPYQEFKTVLSSEIDRVCHTVELARERTDETIVAARAALQADHVDLKARAERLQGEVVSLQTRVREQQQLLSSRYRAESLFRLSGLAVVTLSASLAIEQATGLRLVHPVLAILGLVGAVAFGALAAVRLVAERVGKRP